MGGLPGHGPVVGRLPGAVLGERKVLWLGEGSCGVQGRPRAKAAVETGLSSLSSLWEGVKSCCPLGPESERLRAVSLSDSLLSGR